MDVFSMKEEWLMPGAVVPVDVETTAALVNEIKRLIEAVGAMALEMAAEQEPVAWRLNTANFRKKLPADAEPDAWTPLYTTTPRRKWVGLTPEEAAECWSTSAVRTWENIKAALKEKNA